MYPRHRRRRPRRHKTLGLGASFAQEESRAGLLVTNELEKALADCKAQVERIARDCRAQNRCFRDVEFDLENDRELCLFGLSKENRDLKPSDVQRVTKIFAKPSFFVDGADSNDIIQGRLGDCWFLSALSTMTTAPGLMEKFCIARDEEVGVYGWIFFRDSAWVTVIIDDLLFTSIPKYEELTQAEQGLYHLDKTLYNTSARKGAKSLYFARSAQEGETWVSLFEKAYAKLHGDYTAISGGFSCEAIEDLTGGVSTFIPTKDILNADVFWKEELLLATKDRLFGCGFDTLDPTRSGKEEVTVNGLIGGHAYSVLRAVEYNGKRFVVLRNPWGRLGVDGPVHKFGDDGEFVMEYSDFLDNWDLVEKTLLFDETWVMANQWLQVTARPPSTAWSFGDVSFTITVPAPTKAVIVLSKLDESYFQDLSGNSNWSFDFTLFKKGQKELVARTSLTRFFLRSVNLEVQLEEGEYVVHVRLDREVNDSAPEFNARNSNPRKFSRVQTLRAKGQSIAYNYKPSPVLDIDPIPLEILAGQDLGEVERKASKADKKLKAEAASRKNSKSSENLEKNPTAKEEGMWIAAVKPEPITTSTVLEKTPTQIDKVSAPVKDGDDGSVVANVDSAEEDYGREATTGVRFEDLDNLPSSIADEDLGFRSDLESPPRVASPLLAPLVPSTLAGMNMMDADAAVDSEDDEDADKEEVGSGYDNDTVVLGLRVYTSRDAPAVVGGQLRRGRMKRVSWKALKEAEL
ncbi:Calpain catalytic domain-containing protein [Mycena sanguinolenta]|uniref:Calpain catalytic domain-containing protein n=1 Tax=Mycena sanguinolenta TaxID=230812 RepID=A0A8H6Z5H5_9AGAR|nr:Calpain catalytic domain-containing protein [Mycena sanguinolenta]